jgi:serine/threonine-protein kinase HipA
LSIPPALKYESDGGPGMERIMTLLLGSANALSDRYLFLKTQVLFWLLGAIDGHAKNFSLFLMPGGGYALAPVYDVMSAYPFLSNRQIALKKMKMAMAFKGKHAHYLWDSVLPRHVISTARLCRFPISEAEVMIDGLLQEMDDVIERTAGQLPPDFPGDLARAVFDGMTQARDRFVRLK